MHAHSLRNLLQIYLGSNPVGTDSVRTLIALGLVYKTALSPTDIGHYLVTEKGELLVTELLNVATQAAYG